MAGGMSDQDFQICEELIAEFRQMQERYRVPAAKNVDHRSADVRQQAAVWTRKADRIGQIIDRAERVWLNADNIASIRAGVDIEVEV